MSEENPEVVAVPVTTDASQAKDTVVAESTDEPADPHTFQAND